MKVKGKNTNETGLCSMQEIMEECSSIFLKIHAAKRFTCLSSILFLARLIHVEKNLLMESSLLMNFLIQGRDAYAIFKIDLEKTYDHVHWGFMDYMLRRFGFGKRWHT